MFVLPKKSTKGSRNLARHLVYVVSVPGLQVRLNKFIPFLEPISSTIRPEIPSSLVSYESSGSLHFEDVPGYEIWT